MRLTRRGQIWYATFYDQAGRRHRVSTKCTNRRAAEGALKDLEQRAQGIAPSKPREPFTVAAAIALLESHGLLNSSPWTKRMYKFRGAQIKATTLGDLDVSQLTVEVVRQYCALRQAEEAHGETIRKELVTLQRALEVAREHGHFDGDPRSVLPKWKTTYRPRKRWLTREHFAAILGALISPRHKRWLIVAVYTGARFTEVNELDWRDVDLEAGRILIRGTKTGGSDRVVGIAAELAAELARTPKVDRVGLVAHRWHKAVRDLKAAITRAKLKIEVSPNDLRRTYASWLLQAGVSSFVVAKLLGHGSTRMVELVYGHLSDANLTDAARLLPTVSNVGQGSARNDQEHGIPGKPSESGTK